MTVHKIHYISGLILTVFAGFHLLNHSYAILGAHKHIQLMQSFRVFYRNIFIETLLLLAVLVQIRSGLKLFKTAHRTEKTLYEQLHLFTGLYLSIFLIIHIGAVMVGRILLKLDTNFYFGAAGLNSFPLNLFFIPYYGLALLCFFGHIASIHRKKMNLTILGVSPGKQSMAIFIIGVIWTVIIFYGLTNRFSGVVIPNEYDMLLRK